MNVEKRRFIPARAGNAGHLPAFPAMAPVHPRVRGGTRRCSDRTDKGNRFIPACAGNAVPAAGLRITRAVHPRVRGERACALEVIQCGIGSSPRARGTRQVGNDVHRGLRFIPACAGNARLPLRVATVLSADLRLDETFLRIGLCRRRSSLTFLLGAG